MEGRVKMEGPIMSVPTVVFSMSPSELFKNKSLCLNGQSWHLNTGCYILKFGVPYALALELANSQLLYILCPNSWIVRCNYPNV